MIAKARRDFVHGNRMQSQRYPFATWIFGFVFYSTIKRVRLVRQYAVFGTIPGIETTCREPPGIKAVELGGDEARWSTS